MRKVFFLLLITTGFAANAQLKIDNATFFIGAGATVTVQGDVTSNVDIQGTGLLQMKGSSLQNIDMGGHTVPNLEIDNTSNVTMLNSNTRIGTNLLFTNGRFQTGNLSLVLAPAAGITGYSSSRFVQTNGTGILTKESLGATSFLYPVGFGPGEYNPLTIANNGTVDDISVRCLQNVLANGVTGSPVTADFANNSWVVSEAVAGGSNLDMTAEWVTGDELANFNRVKSGISRYNAGTDWDLPPSTIANASGANPYTRSRTGITTTGVFAVADLDKADAALLNLKFFLQGPSFSGGLMGDNLRSLGLLPLTQPYSSSLSATRFNRLGIYDGSASVNESVPSAAAFDVTGTNDDIVDWVYVALLDGTTPATKLQTRAALLQRDGDVVEYYPATGTYGPVRMPIEGNGNYHILVSHRNHMAIRTATAQALTDNTILSYDFSTAQAKAFGTNPMGPLPSSASLALYGGNVDYNTQIRASGPPSINDDSKLLSRLGVPTAIVTGVYEPFDINMDGTIRASGPPAINDRSKLLSILGSAIVILTEQL